MVRHQPKDCKKTQRLLNDFIAGELSVESSQEILQHLENCRVCQKEQDLREEIRHAIQQSWASQSAPFGMGDRIGTTVLPRPIRSSGLLIRVAAAAVLALLALYLVVWFVPGLLPFLAVDHYHEVVQDHLRCPERLDPSYASLTDDDRVEGLSSLETALQNALQEVPLVSAHLCRYGGIDFIHFVFKGPEQTFSIVLEERGLLRRLAAAELSRQRSVGAISVRLMERDGTSVASFQSHGYFVYLVLDEEDPQQSYRLAEALFPSIDDSLESL